MGDALAQCVGTDPESIGLSCRIDRRQDDSVRKGEGFGESVHQCLGPGVGMGLEDAPDLVVRIILRGLQSRPDLCRMMGIVVDHGSAASQLSFDLEPAVGTVEFQKASAAFVHGRAHQVGCGDGADGIVYVVFTGDAELKAAHVHAPAHQTEGTDAEIVIGDIHRAVIGILCAVGDHSCLDPVGDLLQIGDIGIDDQISAAADILGEAVK